MYSFGLSHLKQRGRQDGLMLSMFSVQQPKGQCGEVGLWGGIRTNQLQTRTLLAFYWPSFYTNRDVLIMDTRHLLLKQGNGPQ